MRTKESVFAYRRIGLFTRAGALVVLAVVAGAFFAWQAVQSASSDSNNWVLASEAGHNSNEAEDVGPGDCEGTFGAPFGTDPAWVRVGGSQSPSDPFSKAEGQVLRPNVNNTTKPNPFVTHTDAYYTHHSMDINVFLTLDPDYRHLLGNGNFANSFEANERGV